MLLSVERPIVGAFALGGPRATLLHRNGLVQAVLPASGNMCKRTIEILQELGRSCRLLDKIPAGAPGDQLQASAAHSAVEERTHRVQTRYRQARQRSAAGWAAGSRSTLIVPMKPGNWSRGTRWREGKTERGCLMLDPGPGNTSEASYLEPRITVTIQDSSPGSQRLAVRRIPHQRNRML